MKYLANDRGMETPLTMAMLIAAVSLIMSVSSFLLTEEVVSGGDELRQYQVDGMGMTFLSILDRDSFPEDNCKDVHYIRYWNGSSINGKDDSHSLSDHIDEVLEWTPDGSWSVAIISSDTIQHPGKEFAFWEWTFPDGINVLILIPVKRSTDPPLEVLR